VWGFGVLFLSCVCVSVSGVLFSVGVCVCDLLIFSRERTPSSPTRTPPSLYMAMSLYIYRFGTLVVPPVSGLVTPQVLLFAGPNSIMGEDTVELHTHGPLSI